MKNLFMVLPMVFLLCFTFACQQGEDVAEEPLVNVEAEKMEVLNILNQYINAMQTKSIETLAEIFSQDDDIMMLDGNTTKKFIGWGAIKTRYQEHFNSYEKLDVKFRELNIKIHASGVVSWLSCVFDWNYLIQGRQGETKGLRATWVLQKKNSKWKVVQLHFSFAKVTG